MMSCHNQYGMIIFISITLCCFFVSQSSNINNGSTTSFFTSSCLPNQASALLKLIQEFEVLKPKSNGFEYTQIDDLHQTCSGTYPNIKYWTAEKDCCSWDGVTCDMETGQVVSLDLSCSRLHGPLNSNSSLFSLHGLQQLNLAFNNFTFSPIPSRLFSQLSRLTHLNLSSSFFTGLIPNEISWLNNLISLDLSHNSIYESSYTLFSHKQVDFITRVVTNMTNLKEIRLDRLDLSSSILPNSLANLSSLELLSLSGCQLQGQFPENIFLLPEIQVVDMSFNDDLTGFLPEFHSGSNLRSLIVYGTKFYGTLPHSIGNLKSLQALDITSCNFIGTIPSSLWNLSELTHVSLSSNNFNDHQLPSGIVKLTNLIVLELHFVQFSGEMPFSLGNLTQLQILDLSRNYFIGEIPSSLGNLKKLRVLNLGNNGFNNQIPWSLGNLTELKSLDLSSSYFNGQIPSSLGNLPRLEYLDMSKNYFSGPVPPSLGKLKNLKDFLLLNNNFSGQIPSSVRNLSQLITFDVSANRFEKVIPWSLFTVSSLEWINLEGNQFSGPLNIQNISLSQLSYLSLSGNKLKGEIPKSISKLRNLTELYLDSNDFSGMVELSVFWNLSQLKYFDLSYNSIFLSNALVNSSTAPPKFTFFRSSSCNISEFPEFLKSQDNLQRLDLSNNKIDGLIPKWFSTVAIESLTLLNLSHNSISGWDQEPLVLPWKQLIYLDLHCNKLRGPLVVPPLSTYLFIISENQLTGSIHPLFCNLSCLEVLDVSNNHLTGIIPPCLGNSSSSFLGLKTLDLGRNQLQGKVPRSLIKCTTLEILNLEHNQISDSFPSWLSKLPVLQVLVLRWNKFHGPISRHESTFSGFVKLRIFDISFNGFSGNVPSEYFKSWSAMTEVSNQQSNSQLRYMGDDSYYHYSVVVMNKGLNMVLVKILDTFTSIDLSNNRFDGQLPRSIQNLQSLHVLNLSSNSFTGTIPSYFGNLKELESLDLSNNNLSGGIPQQLTKLTFLAYLNLSQNHLTGPIPQGGQIGTFPNAFELNLGLCGLPLTKKCDPYIESPKTLNVDQESKSKYGFVFGWRVILMGFGCGLVIGIAAENVATSMWPNWFFITLFYMNMKRKNMNLCC